MRTKGLGALVASAAALGLVAPASALAVKPTVTTGGASNVTFQSATLNGSVNPNRQPTTYYFQYGTTIALGTNTAPASAGAGGKSQHVAADIGGLAPVTRYYYRIVAHNSSGTVLGTRRSFTTRRQPLGVSLTATPNPVSARNSATTLSGTLTGTNNAGRQVVLQADWWPYTQGFVTVTNKQVTNAQGGFSFPLLNVAENMQFRVQMPERPAVVSPIVAFGVLPFVTTKVDKHRVRRGRHIRFSGTVAPAGAGAQIAFQKKRGTQWVTVGGTIVRAHGRYRKSLKIRRGGTYRVWTGVPSGQYSPNTGRSIHIRTFR